MDAHHLMDIAGSLYSHAYGIVNAMLIRLRLPAEICAVYALLEFLLPRGRRNSWASYLRGARFLVVGAVINTLVFTVVWAVFDPDQVKPLAILDLGTLTRSDSLPLRVLGWLVAAFAVSMLGNFIYYWLHRAQHAVPLLWRFHKVHHSVREMSATNSYHHVTESLLEYVVVLVPMTFLLGVAAGPVPWIVLVITGTQDYFIHSSTAIDIGPLRYLIGENRFHRIHHSLEARHFDRNFATSTPLWDVLFGTAYFPQRGEWPEVGFADTQDPQTIGEFLMMPFRSETPAPTPERVQA